ncbi:MAG: S-layer homology domain-containing protein [Bacillota bacterium]|jgi:hypothetical protein
MNNFYRIQNRHHLLYRGFFLTVAVLLLLLVSAASVSAYSLNGTATGNLLVNGYAAEADGLSVYADTENGYALTLSAADGDIVADPDNAQYINIVGDQVYYTSLDGDAKQTELRRYDTVSGEITTIYTVPFAEGLKNLIVLDGELLFISDGAVCGIDVQTGALRPILSGEVREFIPAAGGYLYTLNGGDDLWFYDPVANMSRHLADGVLSFDTDGTDVYYSDGKSGIFRAAIAGGTAARVADGGANIVYGDDLCWKEDAAFRSLSGGVKAEAEYTEGTTFTLLSDGVNVVEEEVVSEDALSVYTTSAAYLSALPAGEYKDWKQSDPRWGGNKMGSSTIAKAGCLVTSVSILLVGSGAEKDSYLAGDFDPGVFVKWLNNNGGFIGAGLVWGAVEKFEPKFKLYTDTRSSGSNFSSLSKSAKISAISGHLRAGRFIVICVHNPSTGNTHWVAVDEVDGDDVLICDPGYRTKTGRLFEDYSTIQRAVIFSYSGTVWKDDSGSANNPVKTTATPKITAVDSGAGKKVTITCATSGATIYYTLDGSAPTTSSKKYTGAFTLDKIATVKAMAVAGGYKQSAVTSVQIIGWQNPFKDVSTARWYYNTIAQVCEYGLFVGTSPTTFAPDRNMTRAEFVNVLARMIPGGGAADSTTDIDFDEYIGVKDFEDVDDSAWYAARLYWAAAKDIMVGHDSAFRPNDPIERQEICAVLIRLANHLGVNLKDTETAVTFSDSKQIASWAKDDVAKAQRAGIIYGRSSKILDPQGEATRAEVAAMILRLMEKM